MLSYEEACRQVTAPGAPFETVEQEVMGVPRTLFRNAPGSLRDVVIGASQRGDATFLVYEDERWSFERFGREVAGLAAALVDRFGVRKGDRVAVAMRNYPEWVVSYAAAVSVGAISVSFNAWWTPDEMDFALRDCGASVLIADEERIERSRGTCDALGIPTIAVRAPAAAATPGGAPVEGWTEVVDPDAAMPDTNIDPDDDATILYTSGTTGNPKGAVSTHRAVVQAIMGYACRSALDKARDPDRLGGKSAPVFILVVPLFHVTGCVPVMLSCLIGGLELVMMYKWQPERALELIEREGVTNFVGVPTQNIDMLNSPAFDRYDTSSLRSVGGGGAPAPPELVQRISTTYASAAPGVGYGMTETNAYGPQNSGPDYVERPTSAGRVTPIMRVEVRDPAGVPVPNGEAGEIWFDGPNLIRGYWNRPDATAEVLVDGWLRSGDVGRLDDEGFIYVEDRIKDMVLRGGENVYCAEVEAAFHEHPAVHEVAVFGVPHERLGEEVAAVVMLRDGASATEEELLEHVAERLAAFKVPTRLRVTSEPLPRNAAGKFLKRELRRSEVEDIAAADA
ncbi:class I adenylate-forming enzyme family protein [Dermatobacter hominis]|uniref:class I adenylate-forming enzyme family protein n=1 Tax=Dermatobacter hominis TaxID=2884263 RepID=UPI001D109701|nr:AMP-binding protein [Dermatobacter hominis]UDY35234.1 AMP-binding protein [Dermatobacter hominis]